MTDHTDTSRLWTGVLVALLLGALALPAAVGGAAAATSSSSTTPTASLGRPPSGMTAIPASQIADLRATSARHGTLTAAGLTAYTSQYPGTTNISIVTQSQANKVAHGTRLSSIARQHVCSNPKAAKQNPNVQCHSQTTPSLVVSDHTHHAGRRIAIPVAPLRRALGYTPRSVTIRNSVTGQTWRSHAHVSQGWLVVHPRHFSNNAVTWTSTVNISGSFSDGSQVSYNLSNASSVSNVAVNLTGQTTHQWANQSASGVAPTTTRSLSIGGNLAPTDGTGGSPQLRVQAANLTGTLTQSSFQQSYSVSSQSTYPYGVAISSDGTKLYVSDHGNFVHEYSLATPWDVNSASLAHSFDVSGQTTSTKNVAFSSDGTSMFVSAGSTIYQYSLSTPWNISTASFTRSQAFSSAIKVQGMDVIQNGSSLVLINRGNKQVRQYTLSTPGNVGTASLSATKSMSAYGRGVALSGNGARLFVSNKGHIRQYALSTPDNISTASLTTTTSVSGHDSGANGITFMPNGTRMYITGTSSASVYQYSSQSNVRSLSVSDGSGQTASYGSFSDGETKTKTLPLSQSSTVLNFSATGGKSISYSLTMQERTQTHSPSLAVNGHWANVSGPLTGGQTASRTLNKSVLQAGRNTVAVALPGVASGPPMQVGVDVTHQATATVSTTYNATEWTESYNITHTYPSRRPSASLRIPFTGDVAAMQALNYRVNQSGSWQQIPKTDYQLSGTTLSVDLPAAYGGPLPAGTTMTVRADGSKVRVTGGSINVTKPTPLGATKLDTGVRIASHQSGQPLVLATNNGKFGNRIHYAYNTWTDADPHTHVTSSATRLVFPNAQTNRTFTAATIPVAATPATSTGDVRVRVPNPSRTTPSFVVHPGSHTGDTIKYRFLNPSSGTQYQLYSVTRGVVLDSGTASANLTLLGGDNAGKVRFQIPNATGSTSTGSSGGVLGSLGGGSGPVSGGGGVLSKPLLIGILLAALGGLYLYYRHEKAAPTGSGGHHSSSSGGSAASGLFDVSGGLVGGFIHGSGRVAGYSWRLTRHAITGSAHASTSIASWLREHPFVTAGLTGLGLLGLLVSGVVQLPHGTGIFALVVGTPVVTWFGMRYFGSTSRLVWLVVTGVAVLLGLQLLGTHLIGGIVNKQTSVILVAGGLYLAYKAVKAYQAPQKVNKISIGSSGNSGNSGGGNGGQN